MAYENMGRGTILIADDVEINRVILGEIIQDMGITPYWQLTERRPLSLSGPIRLC